VYSKATVTVTVTVTCSLNDLLPWGQGGKCAGQALGESTGKRRQEEK